MLLMMMIMIEIATREREREREREKERETRPGTNTLGTTEQQSDNNLCGGRAAQHRVRASPACVLGPFSMLYYVVRTVFAFSLSFFSSLLSLSLYLSLSLLQTKINYSSKGVIKEPDNL